VESGKQWYSKTKLPRELIPEDSCPEMCEFACKSCVGFMALGVSQHMCGGGVGYRQKPLEQLTEEGKRNSSNIFEA
jgi:hypothetical protein